MPTLSNELRQQIKKCFGDTKMPEDDQFEPDVELFDIEETINRIVEFFATQNTALLKEVADDMAALDNYNEHDDSVALYLKKKWGERSKLAAMGGQ